jgi:hypothetical protein
LRWAAVEAVWPGLRADFDLHCFYERMKRRKGANSAKVATARRMLSYSLFGIPDFRFCALANGGFFILKFWWNSRSSFFLDFSLFWVYLFA